ncbi:MAG: hypothetical protein JW982_06775 [Spirochaetes bacterium]|nr:hypothetical protein [Spirochaetota bacterium]
MFNKKIFFGIFYVFLILSSGSVFADLKEFGDDTVKGTEDKKKNDRPVYRDLDKEIEEEDEDESACLDFSDDEDGDEHACFDLSDDEDENDSSDDGEYQDYEEYKKDKKYQEFLEYQENQEYLKAQEFKEDVKKQEYEKYLRKEKQRKSKESLNEPEIKDIQNTDVIQENSEEDGYADTNSCCIPLFISDFAPYYSQYPYKKKQSNFINESIPERQESRKVFLFCVENRFGSYFDEGMGVSFLLNIYSTLLGAELGYEYIQDAEGNYLSYFDLGLNLALFMTGNFETDAIVGIITTNGVMTLDGYSMGLHFQWYPKKPLVFEGKLSYHIFTSREPVITFLNYDIKCGIMLKRTQLFLGYESRMSDNSRLSRVYFGHEWFF